MKRICYFFKSYKFDFVTSIFLIASIFGGYYFRQSQQVLFYISISIILISLLIIIYLRVKDRSFYFIPLTNRKDGDEWIGKGVFKYSRVKKCFQISDSDPGYIFSKCFMWSDYDYKFEFKIIGSCIGIVLRAINLSNYVMLQINKNGIRPHIKINGAWKWWESNEVDLDFEKKLKLDNWYRCFISCEKDVVSIRIYEKNNTIFDRDWIIPSGQINFIFKKSEDKGESLSIPLSLNLEYGTVGFRSSVNEKALIRNVLIKKI